MTTISVFADTALGLGVSATYTLRVGTNITTTGVATATSDLADRSLSCTMNAGSQSCSSTGSVSLNANSLFDVKVVLVGLTPSLHNVVVALVCQ